MNFSGIPSLISGGIGLFGPHKDPSKEAMKYISQIPGQTQQYYNPYIQAGQRQLPQLEDQYNQSMNDPGGRYNKIGESFHESPGFKFAVQQALQGSNHQAAANGMYGTPQHSQQNMQLVNDIANQDYYNYMQGATDIYKTGLGGGQQMANQGQQAGQNYADLIAAIKAQLANLKYAGTQAQNEQRGNAFGDIANGIGQTFGF